MASNEVNINQDTLKVGRSAATGQIQAVEMKAKDVSGLTFRNSSNRECVTIGQNGDLQTTEFSTKQAANIATAGALSNVATTGESFLTFTLATSINGFANATDGKELSILNRNTVNLVLLNESVGATPGNEINTGTGADLVIASGAMVRLKYGQFKWRVAGGSGGSGIKTVVDVTAAELLTVTDGPLIYIESKEGIYNYCASCGYTADGDLVLNTGNGGTTRWELMQKMSRTQGDTGWINTDAAVISALNTTDVRLAISTIASIAIKSVRIPVPIANYDKTITGAAGAKYLYFDDNTLVIKQRDSVWDFNTQVPIMVVYWSGTAIIAAPQSELHGIRDTVWHLYEHLYSGAQYKSGLTFTGNVQTDNNVDPNLDTVQFLWSTAGVCQDEDITFSPGTAPWTQTLGSGLTNTTAAIFNFLYYNGTTVVALSAMSDRTPFIHSGAGTVPQWNNGGTLTNITNGNYAVYHYFASPMLGGYSVFARPHNAQFTSLTLASVARPSDLVWTDISEFKHLYTAIFRVNTGWGPSPDHLCKLVALNDFRKIPGTPNAGVSATDHNALSNRGVYGSHPATAISLDTTNFNGILSTLEIDPQLAFDKIDDSLFIHDTLTNTFTGTTISVTPYRATQEWTYTGVSAQVFTSFGTLATSFRHNQDITIVGSSDINTLTINYNDVANGWLMNGTCELGYGQSIRFLYNGTLARLVEISRSN